MEPKQMRGLRKVAIFLMVVLCAAFIGGMVGVLSGGKVAPIPRTALLGGPKGGFAPPLDRVVSGGIVLRVEFVEVEVSPLYPIAMMLLRMAQCAPVLFLLWGLGDAALSSAQLYRLLGSAGNLFLLVWAVSVAAAFIEYNYLAQIIRRESLSMAVNLTSYGAGLIAGILLRLVAHVVQGQYRAQRGARQKALLQKGTQWEAPQGKALDVQSSEDSAPDPSPFGLVTVRPKKKEATDA